MASGLVLAGQLSVAAPVLAQSSVNTRERFAQIRQGRGPISLAKDDLDKAANQIKDNLQNVIGKAARIITGTVTAINGSSLSVTKDGKTFTINTSTNTQFRRRFWGKSSLTEISINDRVNVIGKWADDLKTTINATLVRDLSIAKRNGTFFGKVTSIGSGTLTIQTLNKGSLTVTIDAGTKLVNRKEQAISASDIKVGDRIRVKGLWDNKNNTITQVKQIKDFSLPVQVTPTPKP